MRGRGCGEQRQGAATPSPRGNGRVYWGGGYSPRTTVLGTKGEWEPNPPRGGTGGPGDLAASRRARVLEHARATACAVMIIKGPPSAVQRAVLVCVYWAPSGAAVHIHMAAADVLGVGAARLSSLLPVLGPGGGSVGLGRMGGLKA